MPLCLPSPLVPQEGLYTRYKALGAGTQTCTDWNIQDLTVNKWQTEKWPPIYSVITTGADSLTLGVWHNIFLGGKLFLPPGLHFLLIINSKSELL